jgi:neutral ceramidase
MTYHIGIGVHDLTGPAAEVGMMGMSDASQKTEGILNRLYARAFVIRERDRLVAIVITDLWSCTIAVKMEVVRRLQGLVDSQGSPLFTVDNVLIGANHTHSGPGGYSHYALYNAAILGFIEQNFECIVDGIVQSIIEAHSRLAPGTILVDQGELHDCGKNRSLVAYEQNPAEERAGQPDTDREMVQLKFESSTGEPLGVLNWYPIHTTSLGETNTLISGDNKGYAGYLLEREVRREHPQFIAAFANSNCGDVSGNVGLGVPNGEFDVENMKRLGRQQYEKAKALLESAATEVTGPVDYRHIFVDMSHVDIEGANQRTWPAAIGVSMIGGSSEDSTNHFVDLGIEEGITTDHEIADEWSLAGNVLMAAISALVPNLTMPTRSDWPPGFEEGHGKKPIIFAQGLAMPFPLTPQILPMQLVRVGSVLISAIPAEITTMAGRRLRQTILDHAASLGQPITVVLTAYANGYAGYITTQEEYSVQHYEGASTLFGPHTLAAYQQEFGRLADALSSGGALDPGPEPLDLSQEQHSLQTGVVFDSAPPLKAFGEVAGLCASHYLPGQKVVARFWAGHPKNNLRLQDTFVRVEQKVDQGGAGWRTVYGDDDFCVAYRWSRVSTILGTSLVTATWTIPEDAQLGTYRIRHNGEFKERSGEINAYQGFSPQFEVVAALSTDRLYFTNESPEEIDLQFYHPGDRIRAIPLSSLTLAPGESSDFEIPTGVHPLQGPWEGKIQVKFELPGKDQVKTLTGGQRTSISKSQTLIETT